MRGSLRKQMMANLKKSAHSTKYLFSGYYLDGHVHVTVSVIVSVSCETLTFSHVVRVSP